MSKGGSVGSQGTTQQARGSFSGNSRPSYGGNQAGGLGSKGGSQSYQEPYRSPYGQGPSYSQHGMRSGFGGFMGNTQAMPTQLPSQLPFDYGNSTSTPSGGQIVIEPPLSIDEQMNSPNYQGLLKRREESRGQDADAQRQLDLLQSSFKEQREREEIRTRGPESLVGRGPSGTFQQFGDFSVGVEGPPITYGTATPNFNVLGQVAGDNNNAEALMRIGQVAPHPHFKQERNLQDIQYGQVAPQQFSGGFGSKGGLMNQTDRGYRSGIGGFF